MSSEDNYVKILEKISEIAVDTGILKNEVGHIKLGLSDTREQIERINQQDIEQNKLLDEHILGVKTAMERLELEKAVRKQNDILVQKQMEEIDSRLKRTEIIPNFLTGAKKVAKWIAALGTAILIILKLTKAL